MVSILNSSLIEYKVKKLNYTSRILSGHLINDNIFNRFSCWLELQGPEVTIFEEKSSQYTL